MDGWTWTLSSEFELRKCELELDYLIVVIFDMKSEVKVVSNDYKSIYGGLVVNLNWAYTRVSWSCMSKVNFWIKYVYLDWARWNLEVGYVMRLKTMLCEFCLN